MKNEIEFLELMERTEHQRSARRNFIRLCGGATAMAGGLALLGACHDNDDDNNGGGTVTPTPTPTSSTAVGDPDILNFALQLEYLEANYYSYAVTGAGIAANLQTGNGTQGAVVTGSGAGAARAVTFTDAVVAQYAREIAADEIAHVTFLRGQLMGAAQAQPVINLSGSASVQANGATVPGAFTAAARAAQVIGPNDIFDPFLNDENFLIGSYLLTDVGVTAYRGAARLISSKVFLEASAGILATECYHDGVIRAELWRRGLTVPSIYTRITAISNARDGLDGASDTDQDIGTAATANIVPTTPTTANGAPTAGGLVLGRTANQVLNVVYQTPGSGIATGGFFPAGVNGTIHTT